MTQSSNVVVAEPRSAPAPLGHDTSTAAGAEVERQEIHFPQGLPGFPTATRFVLRPATVGSSLLMLTSSDDPSLRFLVMPYIEGRLPLASDDLSEACAALGLARADVAVLLVITAQSLPGAVRRNLYVNLRAPIFVDTVHGAAVQYVLPCPNYVVRHLLAA